MEIRATSTFDYDLIKALVHFNMFKKADPKKRMLLWGIIHSILLIVIVIETILFGIDEMLALIVVIIVIGPLLYFMYFLLPKIKYKQLGNMQNAKNEFIFQDDIIITSTRSDDYYETYEIKYPMIKKVMETSKYIFIFEKSMKLFIIDTSSVVGGTKEEIINKLMSHREIKYIICDY